MKSRSQPALITRLLWSSIVTQNNEV